MDQEDVSKNQDDISDDQADISEKKGGNGSEGGGSLDDCQDDDEHKETGRSNRKVVNALKTYKLYMSLRIVGNSRHPNKLIFTVLKGVFLCKSVSVHNFSVQVTVIES